VYECRRPKLARKSRSATLSEPSLTPTWRNVSLAERILGVLPTTCFRAYPSDRSRRCAGSSSTEPGESCASAKSGKRPAHAPYSSAAFAINAFGSWLDREAELRVAGLGSFSKPLEIESRQHISHGGGIANLDVLLQTDAVVVGVESKLTAPLRAHDPVRWRAPYHDPKMKTILNDGWNDVFAASLPARWQPKYLGLEQLIKHALALASRFPDHERHLIYVWWEPENPEELPELDTTASRSPSLCVGSVMPRRHSIR
jgi:hypothetical protein